MEDETSSLDGKGLINMRVVDLKLELDKRGLSKSGSKKDLVKRLKQQLEFEKLCEERKSGDSCPKLELDAEIQQNEFVQQYLAQQQKRYAERQEEKRLELEAMQKCQEEGSTIHTEPQSEPDESTSSDFDDKDDDKQNLINKPSEKESLTENTENTNATLLKSVEPNNKALYTSEGESKPEIPEESILSRHRCISTGDSEVENNCKNIKQIKIDGNQNIIQNLNNVTENEDIKVSQSKNLSETETKILIPIEHNKDTDNQVCISDNNDATERQKHFEVNICNELLYEKDSKVAVDTYNEELTESGKYQSTSSFTSEEVGKTVSYSVSPKNDSSDQLTKQKSSENMEVSDCSSVPYSLSDIQLPESPKCHVKSNDTKNEEGNQSDHLSDEVANDNSHSDYKNKSNGEAVLKLSSSQDDEMSESETKDSSHSNDSPDKNKVTKIKRYSDESSDADYDRKRSPYKKKSFKHEDTSSNLSTDSKIIKGAKVKRHSESSDTESDKPRSPYKKKSFRYENTSSNSAADSEKNKMAKIKRHSDESSDAESSRNRSPYEKKSLKYEDTSSNLAVDSDNDLPKDTLSNKQKHVKTQQNIESDKNKSSDSEKHNRHDSKRKSRIKHRKRDSRSSSSSSSKSSDSSSEKRHSKKQIAVKSKDFIQDKESSQVSDKNSDEKSVRHKKNDPVKVSPPVSSVSVKKRLKIKRDNVPIEIPSPTKESSETNTTSKSVEYEKQPDSQFSSDKSIKQESHDEKEKTPEITCIPQKVTLKSHKLNRKSSEEFAEPKSKKQKWGSFSFTPKSSDLNSVSAGSLRNWFPDFKLINETSMEVEQDEHSLSAIEEKSDFPQTDVLTENDSDMKLESTSQIDIEDSVSQEPNFDSNTVLGDVSKIIFIQNLVRPFTLNQLKDLLQQNGRIVEEYFWIDKIKSKCFVMYETKKEAIKAKNALNNTRWPSSNPKILSVEFSSIEELEKHKKGNEAPPSKPPEQPAIEPSDILETKRSHSVEEHKRKDKERRKEKDRTKLQAPVREWDKDKIVQESPERERTTKEEKSKSSEKKEKKESKKRATEDTPAKLLDDLFQKTKSIPCIYWLPLTEEQAKAKEEERKMRRLEREKRNQQLKEQEEVERRNRRARSSSRRREKENRKSSTRSRSPVSRRR